jgi:hypothetical protein
VRGHEQERGGDGADEHERGGILPARSRGAHAARFEPRGGRGDDEVGVARGDRIGHPRRGHAAHPLDGRLAVFAPLEVERELGLRNLVEARNLEQRDLEIGHSTRRLHCSISGRRHASSPK